MADPRHWVKPIAPGKVRRYLATELRRRRASEGASVVFVCWHRGTDFGGRRGCVCIEVIAVALMVVCRVGKCVRTKRKCETMEDGRIMHGAECDSSS